MGILYAGSFAKEGIGFVKEKDLAGEFGFFKYTVEVFFGFTDIGRYQDSKIHPVYIFTQPAPQPLGGDGLARAAAACHPDPLAVAGEGKGAGGGGDREFGSVF